MTSPPCYLIELVSAAITLGEQSTSLVGKQKPIPANRDLSTDIDLCRDYELLILLGLSTERVFDLFGFMGGTLSSMCLFFRF